MSDQRGQRIEAIQARLAELQERGWTLAALADELGHTVNAIEKWKAGDRAPSNFNAVMLALEALSKRRRVPKKRRYAKGSRWGKGEGETAPEA